MTDPVLEQDVSTVEDTPDERAIDQESKTGPYVQPVIVSFSLDPHGIESGDALTANG